MLTLPPILLALIIGGFVVILSGVVTLLSVMRRQRTQRELTVPDFSRIARKYDKNAFKRETQTIPIVRLHEMDESEQFVITVNPDAKAG